MAAASEGEGSDGGGGGEGKRLWSKHRATLALVTRVKPSQAAPIEALTTPRLAKLREQRTVYDLFAGIDNNPDHSMEEEHSKTQSSALPAELSLPEERGLAQLELSPGFAPLRRVARRGKSSAQAEAASLEVLASEQRKSSKRLQRVVRSTSRSLLDEGISMGEIYASKQVCCWPLHLPTFFARPHVSCIHHHQSSTSRAAAPQVLNKRWFGPGWQPWGSQGNSSWGPGNRDPSTRLESAQSRTIEELTHAAVPRVKDEWDGERKRAARRRAQPQEQELARRKSSFPD